MPKIILTINTPLESRPRENGERLPALLLSRQNDPSPLNPRPR